MQALPLLLLGLTPLAPPPAAAGPPAPAAAAELQQEAREYASQVNHFANQIHRGYVRELQRPDLLAAAVAALYEAVQRPVPPGLRTRTAA
jgi:hypothetical protein